MSFITKLKIRKIDKLKKTSGNEKRMKSLNSNTSTYLFDAIRKAGISEKLPEVVPDPQSFGSLFADYLI